jgi:ATP-dependent RNA helicase DeaD
MPRPIQDLIQRFSRDPQNVKISQKTVTVPTVEQIYYEVDRRFKVELLTRLIDLHDLKLGIIFCNTKRMVDDLTDHLNAQGYSADRLHGDMGQAMRDRVMGKFRKSGLEFLVATDVAARGIDVDDVQVVFNYDLPYDVEDYVHRIGRTGRAGRAGMAISFVAGREVFQIQNIERFTRTRIHRSKIPTADEVEEARAGAILNKVRLTLASGEYKQQEPLIELLLEQGFASTDIAAAVLHMLQTSTAAPATRPPEPERPHQRARFDDAPPEQRERPARREFADARPPRPAKPVSTTPRKPSGPAKEIAIPAPASQPAAAPVQPMIATETPAVGLPPAAVLRPALPQAIIAVEPPAAPVALEKPKAPAPIAPRMPLPPLRKKEEPKPAPAPKVSRRTPKDQTRLFMNIGSEMEITAADVTSSIQGVTGLPASAIGEVDLRERHLFVDVSAEHANSIIAKLNRSQIKGRNLKVKVA